MTYINLFYAINFFNLPQIPVLLPFYPKSTFLELSSADFRLAVSRVQKLLLNMIICIPMILSSWQLFQRCLIKVLNIDLWRLYLQYIRESKATLPTYKYVFHKILLHNLLLLFIDILFGFTLQLG